MLAESTDVAIVGAGACGSLVAKELTAHGFSVVILEAGKRFDPATDLVNSESNAAKIMWTEPRVPAGKHGVIPKAGVGVGGGTLAWLGVAPRFHPADFRNVLERGRGRGLANLLRRPASAL
jgi:choline dehydrogenase-like flavoprotein